MSIHDSEPFYPPPSVTRRRHGWAVLGFMLFVALPTGLSAWYWYSLAADRYVSSLRYAIRGGPGLESADAPLGGASAVGLAAGGADGFILEDYLRSPAALAALEARLPLRAMLARDGDDPVRRYDPAMAPERLLGFWNAALDLRFDVLTGVTEVDVALFRAQDSEAVAKVLVTLLQALVDSLSERQRGDMLAYVEGEFAIAEAQLQRSLDAIEAFRRRTRTVSPTEEAELNTATIAQLTAEATGLAVRLRTLIETVPNSPQIPRLREQVQSLEAQIASTRATVGGRSDEALPDQLTDFERLKNEYQIALDSYVATLALRQQAQASAALARAHLVVFVPPQAAKMATGPDRLEAVLTVATISLLGWVVCRILIASLGTP
ncbi:MAG: hypothetical protein AAF677_02045 [Pseudomonadota bacterium]